MAEITADMLHATKGEFIAHYNFGPGGYGYGFRNISYPRLSWIERTFKGEAAKKAGRSFEHIFKVDGSYVSDLEEAALRLMQPPILTDGEKAALDCIGDGWFGARELRARCLPDGEVNAQIVIMHALADKGMIECQWFSTENPELAKIRPTEPKWRRVLTEAANG